MESIKYLFNDLEFRQQMYENVIKDYEYEQQ